MRKVIGPSAAARGDTALRIALTDALSARTESKPGDKSWGNAMLQFHETILQAGGNEFLTALWLSIQVVLQWSANLRLAVVSYDPGYDWRGDYTTLLDKIIGRDPEGAMVAMASLIDGAMLEAFYLLTHSALTATREPA